MTPTTTTTTQASTHTPTQTPTQTPTRSTDSSRSTFGARAKNITIETPIIGAAIAGFVGLAAMIPELAFVLFGIPIAAAFGIGTLVFAARLLAR